MLLIARRNSHPNHPSDNMLIQIHYTSKANESLVSMEMQVVDLLSLGGVMKTLALVSDDDMHFSQAGMEEDDE